MVSWIVLQLADSVSQVFAPAMTKITTHNAPAAHACDIEDFVNSLRN